MPARTLNFSTVLPNEFIQRHYNSCPGCGAFLSRQVITGAATQAFLSGVASRDLL